jgi:hypothetical protein
MLWVYGTDAFEESGGPSVCARRLGQSSAISALTTAPWAARVQLLHVLMLPDFDRADAIGPTGRIPRPAPSPNC